MAHADTHPSLFLAAVSTGTAVKPDVSCSCFSPSLMIRAGLQQGTVPVKSPLPPGQPHRVRVLLQSLLAT
jgi:hypothetical protein